MFLDPVAALGTGGGYGGGGYGWRREPGDSASPVTGASPEMGGSPEMVDAVADWS